MSNSRPKLKLGLDERDELRELIDSQGWLKLLTCLSQLVERKGKSVLTLNEPDRLLKAKSEYDGQIELLSQIRDLKKILSE